MPRGRNKRIIEHILPSVVIGAIFLLILATGGYSPFGKDTIDYYDMAQQAEAYYYHNFDQLHGVKSFVFDWYTNLGRGIPGLSEPSLYDLLLFIIPRGCILQAMSLMMLIKIMAAAFFMGLFIEYLNPQMPFIYRLMLSSGYGLCGFVLANYTIPQWVDMASFVPLILLFSQKTLKDGKILGLSLSVFVISVIDTYFSIQTITLIFFMGGIFLIIDLVSGKKTIERLQLHIFRFAIGLVLGIGLSAFSFLPDLVLSFSSARFGNGSGDGGLLQNYLDILRTVQPAYLSRWFALLSLGFPSALVILGSFRKIKKKQYAAILFWAFCVFFSVLQLFLESTHLILHFGSYVNYPARNSFMIYCIIAGIAAWSYEPEDNTGREKSVGSRFMMISGIAGGVALALVFSKVYAAKTDISDHDVLLFTMGLMGLCCILHLIFLLMNHGGMKAASIGIWTAEILIFGIIMIGKPSYISPYGNDPEQEGEYIRIADQVVSELGERFSTGEEAATNRIKNPDTSLNTNYGMIMRRETLSGWTGYATADVIGGAVSLGYSSQFTRLLDSGGNIFSDTLLHITDVIGLEHPDDRLYEEYATVTAIVDHLSGATEEYHLAHNRFTLPFALPIANPEALGDVQGDIVNNMNSYARAIGCPEEIAAYVSDGVGQIHENGCEVVTSEIHVKGNQSLYLVGNCVDDEGYNSRITVNGKTIKIPSIKETDNELYPAHFNNNSIPLGSFEDEDVKIVVETDTNVSENRIDARVYRIDIDVLRNLCDNMPNGINIKQGRRSLDVEISNSSEYFKGILIPIPYNSGWSAILNGNRQEITGVNGVFMYIPVLPGSDTIHMSYFPPYMSMGIGVTAAAALIVILIVISDKGKQVKTGRLDIIFCVIYEVAFSIAFLLVYAIPISYAVINRMV